MKNRWKYDGLGQVRYGHMESYVKAADYFDQVGGLVEDWGCGCAAFKLFLKRCEYWGVDGSPNAYADRSDIDLVTYKSHCDHILLRDVLDHNLQWENILHNAIESFRQRMVVIIFRDMAPKTEVVFINTDGKYPGVADLHFNREDLLRHLSPYLKREEKIGHETMFYCEKS